MRGSGHVLRGQEWGSCPSVPTRRGTARLPRDPVTEEAQGGSQPILGKSGCQPRTDCCSVPVLRSHHEGSPPQLVSHVHLGLVAQKQL